VVLAVEKVVTSRLFESGVNKRVFIIDQHIGMTIAGLLADARSLVNVAREEAKNYRLNYGSSIPLKVCYSFDSFIIVAFITELIFGFSHSRKKVFDRQTFRLHACAYFVRRRQTIRCFGYSGLLRE
jgi:20S proteasome alpha/beta subunit